MILRNIASAFRRQDWFTVFVEIVIVVLGVFLGLQVSNWNEQRAHHAKEREFLTQLRNELKESGYVIDAQSRYVAEVVASGQRALAYLKGGEDCETHCEELLIDFFHSSQVWGTSFDYTKYQEALRLGFPSDPATKEAVKQFYVYLNGWDTVNGAAPAYRERTRGFFTPDAAAVLWRGCMQLPGSEIEELTRDCVDELAPLDVAAMLRDIHSDSALVELLQFWLGQNIFALTGYPDMRGNADAAIAAITSQIDRHE
jgi:hypothetical protein